MNDAWKRMHELNELADAALKEALDGLGTARFPLLLVEYHRAMERASKCRLTIRVASPEILKDHAGRIARLGRRA
jgi:hypothetical protein